jgi:two-component system response regulator
MSHLDAVDILLVEDNPRDAELTVRALKKRNLANRLFVVEDGVEALDFIFLGVSTRGGRRPTRRKWCSLT